MPDSYSIALTHGTDEVAKAWEAARIVTTTIEHVSPGGRMLKETPWELATDERRWYRKTLKDLEVLAAGLELKAFVVYWNYFVSGLAWSVTVMFWDDGRTSLNVSAYAGSDRMATEEAVRLVVKHAAARGVKLRQQPTRISSSEGGPEGSGGQLLINSKPMKKWAMFRAWVGPHMASYVVAVFAGVTVAVLLVILGIGR